MGKLPIQVTLELEDLERQFGQKAYLTLDDYAELYGCCRSDAARNLKRRGIPYHRGGKYIFISMRDVAIYMAKHKFDGDAPLIVTRLAVDEEMKRRRGFCQRAEKRLMES